MNRKHTEKRIAERAGRGQMRRRVTAGRLGKLGLTLFVLTGVFFSLFTAVLDPVVWAADVDTDVPTVEEMPPEEEAPVEVPEEIPEETGYPVRIHVATEDGEELVEVTVPAGSSVAETLGGGALYSVEEADDTETAAEWAAGYDWYTLDEEGGYAPYDITAEVTAALELYAADGARAASATTVLFYAAIDGEWVTVEQKTVSQTTTLFGKERYYLTLAEMAEVYGPYGFDADSYQGERFFPHLDSAEREQRIWADVTPRVNGDEGYWIPLGAVGRAFNSVYYTPRNTEGSDSYFTEYQKYIDPQLMADSMFYTVSVKDHSGALPPDKLPETRYIPNGEGFTVTLPVAEGVHWVAADPLTGEEVDLSGAEDTESGTVTYTVAGISHPYRFSAYSDQKVIVYKAGLAASLVDLSNELPVGAQSIIVDGSVRGSLTYSDRCAPQQRSYTVLSPDNDRAAIKLVKGNALNRRFIYRFTGWRVSGSNIVLQPGRAVNLDDLGPYMDPITHEVTLTAVWTPFADNSERIETVNFFVSLNCEIADNMSNGFASQPQSNFTSSLAYTRVRGAESLGSGHDNAMVIAPPEESSTAYEVDSELRKLTTTPCQGLTLETFPSDEAIFENIRNGSYTIKIDGVTIDRQYLTSEHFTIRWYVLKYEHSDGFHIDGVLVAKAGRLVVKKTFTGNRDAIAAVKEDFYISVEHHSDVDRDEETLDYDLSLRPLVEEDREDFTGYTDYDPDSDTYTWVLLGRQEQMYYVREHNVSPPEGINYTARYAITNSAAQTGGWVDYPDEGISAKVTSYASDVPDAAVQIVALQNIYVKAGLLTVAKLDSNTGNGIRDVAFRLEHEDDTALSLYRKPGTNEYTTSDQEAGYTELVTDNMMRSGPNGYFYIKLAADGRPYTLEEVVPDGYFGPEKVRFTVDENGTITSLTELPDTGTLQWASGLGGKMLTLKNASRLLTEVTARKDWGVVYEREKEPVTVALYRNGVRMTGPGNDELAYQAVLDEENDWTCTWRDLPLFVDGQSALYSLRELRIGDAAYDAAIDDGYENYLVTYDQPLYWESASGQESMDARWESADGVVHYADHVLLVVNNDVVTGEIAFAKVSDSGAPVSGAEFGLYSDPSCTEESRLDTAVSNDSGFVKFAGRSAGVYYLKEAAAPQGFVRNDTVYKVTIHAGKAHITQLGGSGEDVHQIVNESSLALTLEKYSVGGSRLGGAVFTLRRTGDVPEDIRDELGGTYTVGDDGTVVMDGLVSGDYELRETTAPEGYRTREEAFCFRVHNGQLSQIAPYPQEGWMLTAYGDGSYVLTVTDEALFTFPTTGGSGIYVPIALGTVMMCAAAWLMLRPRQKGKRLAQAGVNYIQIYKNFEKRRSL